MPKCSPWSQSRLTLSVWYHFVIQIYVMCDYSQKIDSSLATIFQRQSVMWDFLEPEQSHVALMWPAFSGLVFGCLQWFKGAQLLTSKILSTPQHFSDCLNDGRTWTMFPNLKLPWRRKLELLSHTVILNIFKPCSSLRKLTNGGMSLWIIIYLPTEEGMHLSLTWTELACAEGCFPNDHHKLLLVVGAGEVVHTAFSSCIISLCFAGCWGVAAPQHLGDAVTL